MAFHWGLHASPTGKPWGETALTGASAEGQFPSSPTLPLPCFLPFWVKSAKGGHPQLTPGSYAFSPTGGCCLVTKSCLTLLWPHGLVHQAPPPMEFSRREYWSGLPFPSARDLPNAGMKPASPELASRFFSTEPPGKTSLLIPTW